MHANRDDDRSELELRKRRLSRMVVTRSPSSYGEIPEENIAKKETDDRKRGWREVEEFGKPDKPA